MRKIGTTLIVGGLLLMLFGLSAWPAQGAELARPAAQPSPRPTLPPTATRAAPTATSGGPSSTPKSHDGGSGAAGRLTGTIIDLTTGAPAPGIAVDLSGLRVVSDANGNYDHWLAPGSYQVALALAAGRGEPAQGPQTVEMQAGATVVLHLSFRSPPLPTATPAPASATPARARATPTAARAGAAGRALAPTRLPVTGEQPGSAWLWLLIGAMLLAMGGALEFGGARLRAALPAGSARFGGARIVEQATPRPAPQDPADLLAALLADPRPHRAPSAARPTDPSDDLLAELLRASPREER